MTVLCVAAAEHGGLIKQKEKESSWVKLKAFPTNVERPNQRLNYVKKARRQAI